MEAKEFVDLYESFRDYKIEMSLLDEDYQGYKNRLDFLKHTNPEKYKEYIAKSVARNKAKKEARMETMDPETRAAKIKNLLKTEFSRILKRHNVITATTYYDEKKQLAQTSPEQLEQDKPEVLEDILSAIEKSGIDPDEGLNVFYQLFGTYADRKHANFLYSKQRQENREPDDPFDQQRKAQDKESKAKQRSETIEDLKTETNMAEFSKKLYDLILTHDLKKTKPALIQLKNELSEDDPKQRFIDIALNKNLKIKYQNKNLEDFNDQEDKVE